MGFEHDEAESPTPTNGSAGTVRFVWRADAAGRFTEVSPELAQVVGKDAAAIVGRSWREIEGRLVEDPGGEVARLFERAETWSSRTVFWRSAEDGPTVAVDLAGLPLLGPNRQLLGFRGFGLCRAPTSGMGREVAPASQQRPAADLAPRLTEQERLAFREIARALGAAFRGDDAPDAHVTRRVTEAAPRRGPAPDPNGTRVLDQLPIGVLIHRGDVALFANRVLLDMLGYDSVAQLATAGGLPRLFPGRAVPAPDGPAGAVLAARSGTQVPAEVRLAETEWDGAPAALVLIRRLAEADPAQRTRALELDLQAREARVRELTAILDTATDGVVLVDETGRVRGMNRSAEALFGYDEREIVGEPFIVLLATESHPAALEYFDGLRRSGLESVLNDGREVAGRVRQGGTMPLFMTMGRVGDTPERTFCAVLRDISAFKMAERELLGAKRAAEAASAHKSDFLAKVSHEIRTPLSAIIGFAEVMIEERFGPIANERYKEYLRDIHDSGRHVVSLVNDLLDLAKIEAGRMELSLASVALNDLVAASVALLQPQAARERIIMRTSFAAQLPPVIADARSVRQIVLNLVSNAVKFTEAGGQVIVSTALTDRGEVAFRVRDTGIGMSEQELNAALEPFRQVSTGRRGGGTGLGLPLTKALVEANRGALQITSAPDAGTLAEVLFAPMRVVAQ